METIDQEYCERILLGAAKRVNRVAKKMSREAFLEIINLVKETGHSVSGRISGGNVVELVLDGVDITEKIK